MEQEVNGKVQKINEEDYEIIKKLETIGYKKQLNGIKRTMIVNLMKLKRLSRQFGRNIKCHIQDPIWMKSERCLSQQKVLLEQ
jgi:hypothetical protein